MPKLIIVSGTLLFLYLMYFVIAPHYSFKYYYSNNKQIILTSVRRVNYFTLTNETFFTPGFYNRHVTPDIYIKPLGLGHEEWYEYAILHSNGILIIGDTAQTNKISANFNFIENSFSDYSKVRQKDSLVHLLKNKTGYQLRSIDD